METKVETVQERLLRELKAMTARHAMAPAIQKAVEPLIPMAEQIAAGQDETLRQAYTGAVDIMREADGILGGGHRELTRENFLDSIRALKNTADAAGEAIQARDQAQEDAATLRRQLVETQEREAALAEKLERIPVISPNLPALELEQAKDVYAEGMALGMSIGKAEATGSVIPDRPVTVEELNKAKGAVERMIARLQPDSSAPDSSDDEPQICDPGPAPGPLKPGPLVGELPSTDFSAAAGVTYTPNDGPPAPRQGRKGKK